MAFEKKEKTKATGNNAALYNQKDVQKRYQQDLSRYQAQIEKTRQVMGRQKAA